MTFLFLDSVIVKAEGEISHHDDKWFLGSSHKNLACTFHTLSLPSKHQTPARKPNHQPGNTRLSRSEQGRTRLPNTHSDWPRVSVLINGNYFVTQRGFVERAGRTETFVYNCQTLNVNCVFCESCTFSRWAATQKKTVRPIVKLRKFVKGASCVDQLSSSTCHQCQYVPAGARVNQLIKLGPALRS